MSDWKAVHPSAGVARAPRQPQRRRVRRSDAARSPFCCFAPRRPASPTPTLSSSGGPNGGSPRRIVVVGSTGAGKTTLAWRLARDLAMPHIELDALHWGPEWTPAPAATFRERVAEATASARWVVDGNYIRVRDLLWGRADTVVWLDYPLWLIFARLLPRTFRRVLRHEQLWNGNRERLWEQFFSRDSLLLWALQTYRRQRREFPALFRQPEFTHLRVVRLRSPGQTEAWLRRNGTPRGRPSD